MRGSGTSPNIIGNLPSMDHHTAAGRRAIDGLARRPETDVTPGELIEKVADLTTSSGSLCSRRTITALPERVRS